MICDNIKYVIVITQHTQPKTKTTSKQTNKQTKINKHTKMIDKKEKDSCNNYNLACILTLPRYQRKGVGRFLIDLCMCFVFCVCV